MPARGAGTMAWRACVKLALAHSGALTRRTLKRDQYLRASHVKGWPA